MDYGRILTIQDISCVGQCSMTVALPILSAWGHETCILPTEILSTHTGGFSAPAVHHLGRNLEAIWKHWHREGILFDAILTGYLGSAEAADIAGDIADHLLAPGGELIVDPAMADHGKLYSGLDRDCWDAMERLCRKADILLPNLTEAAMLAGIPYRNEPDEKYVEDVLAGLNFPNVVITGVGYHTGETGVEILEDGRRRRYSHKRIGNSYHGTGDIFSACFTGARVTGKGLFQAASAAADFTSLCIENTARAPAHSYGVKFETALPAIWNMR